MTTFGLVHGAYHGAWCWEPLAARLRAQGHDVLTVDLPTEDPQAGAAEYAAVAMEAFASAPDDLVLVGHSLAGLTIPVIAERRPVGRLVFLCAMIPRPGRSYDEVLAEEPDTIAPLPSEGASAGPDGEVRWEPEVGAVVFFADCPADMANWAAHQLRGQCWKVTREPSPLTAWPAVPRTSIIGKHDAVITPAWSRRVTPSVLGVVPIELDCGHAPFLSAPDELARTLIASTDEPVRV